MEENEEQYWIIIDDDFEWDGEDEWYTVIECECPYCHKRIHEDRPKICPNCGKRVYL